jgi:prevent-host-death family protein
MSGKSDLQVLYDQQVGQEATMKHVNIAEAKAHFSELIAEVESGRTVEIARRGKIVARLTPVDQPRGKIDIAALRRHQARLTSPQQSTETELREWKDDERF